MLLGIMVDRRRRAMRFLYHLAAGFVSDGIGSPLHGGYLDGTRRNQMVRLAKENSMTYPAGPVRAAAA
jgi:hypothetical protein